MPYPITFSDPKDIETLATCLCAAGLDGTALIIPVEYAKLIEAFLAQVDPSIPGIHELEQGIIHFKRAMGVR